MLPRRPSFVLGGVAASLVLAALAWVGAREPGSSPGRGDPPRGPASTPLDSPASVSLGELRPGESARAHLSLSNATSIPRTVARVETSCECVSAEALPIRIAPHESRSLAISFRPDHEPTFRGKLSVVLVGRDDRDAPLFRSRADLEVRDRPPSPPR